MKPTLTSPQPPTEIKITLTKEQLIRFAMDHLEALGVEASYNRAFVTPRWGGCDDIEQEMECIGIVSADAIEISLYLDASLGDATDDPSLL